MAETGFQLVQSGANNNDAGNEAWGNPGNITNDSDSDYATAELQDGETTQYLHGTNPDLSVPTFATILGVEVRIRKEKDGTEDIIDHTVQLIKDGTRQGDNNAKGGAWPGDGFSNFDYGGSSDTWGLTLDYLDVNSSDFGVAVRAKNDGSNFVADPKVAAVWINVHYEENVGPQALDSGVWKESEPSARHSGVWKPTEVSARQSGVWKGLV